MGTTFFGQCYLAIQLANGTGLDLNVGAGKGWSDCTYGNVSPLAIAVQGDGKIVVAGKATGQNSNLDMAIARWQANLGGLDTQFNGGNPQTIAIEVGGSSNDSAEAVLLQSDGKILVAGSAGTQTAFARLLPNGLADNSTNDPGSPFGLLQDGRAHYAFGSNASVSAITLDRYGRFVFGGFADNQWLIGRLLADGTAQDPTFNGGSAQQFLLEGVTGNNVVKAIARQSDGKTLAVGYAPRTTSSAELFVGAARLLVDGSFDNTFGSLGRAAATFTDASAGCCGYSDHGEAIAIGGGGIALAGHGQARMGGSDQFGVARLLLDLVFTDPFE